MKLSDEEISELINDCGGPLPTTRAEMAMLRVLVQHCYQAGWDDARAESESAAADMNTLS